MPINPFDDEEYGGFGSSGADPGLKTSRTFEANSGGLGFVPNAQVQISDSRTRTQASQHRALASIANSEQIAISTTEELVEQGEKLDRAEQRLDEISELQKDSQRHINSLSSVFGGLKNIFSRRSSQPVATERQTTQSRNSIQAPRPTEARSNLVSQQADISNLPATNAQDGDFERNLALMSQGMSRLKSLAEGMNEELKAQNAQLDRMAPRVERVNDTVGQQNRQMNKLLGIKPK